MGCQLRYPRTTYFIVIVISHSQYVLNTTYDITNIWYCQPIGVICIEGVQDSLLGGGMPEALGRPYVREG
jgi:hypothetical protein